MFRTVLPNFFVVGAGKAGTTSLHRYLSQHPQIYMSPVKEPCYFAPEVRLENLTAPVLEHVRRQANGRAAVWLAAEWPDYVRLFQNVTDESAVGEASAAYLWSETAARNIHAHVPGARIVIMLRDPAERAFSQYLHQLSTGLTCAPFHQHLRECLRRRGQQLGIHYPFLEVGLYARQVKRYLDTFPRQQIRVYWYEECWRDPANLLRDLFGFLKVDPGFPADLRERALERKAPRYPAAHYWLKKLSLWYPLRGLLPDTVRERLRGAAFRRGPSLLMDPADRRFLTDYYREDIGALATLLDRDLSAWLR
jgi:hypothetical protein